VAKSVGAAAGPTTTLSPAADTSVYAVTPFTNYGAATGLLVQNDSNFYTADDAEAYLRFNTSGVSGTITKAVLTLTPLALGRSAGNLTVGVQLLQAGDDTSWVEGTGGTNYATSGPMTWYNSPWGAGQIAMAAGSQLAVDSPISIDVTSLLNQGISTNGVASFVIGAVSWYGRNQMVDFASRENSTAAYRPTLSITLAGPVVPPPAVSRQPAVSNQTNSTATLLVLGADSAPNASLVYAWSVSGPSGAPSPTFSSNGGNASSNTNVTFEQAGTYTFTATITNPTDRLSVVSKPVTVTVLQALSGIQVTPATTTVAVGTTQQFAAVGIDQFGQAMSSVLNRATWSFVGAGSFNSTTGLYTAPATLGSTTTATVTAESGSYTASSSVTLVTAFDGIKNPTLSSLTESLDADGSIGRTDMIAILRAAETLNGGVISQGVLTDLKTLLAAASVLKIPGYVQVLASDVINGNMANADYQGHTLGNLAVGSSGTHLDDLIDKWFLGSDLPSTGGYSYSAVSGPLFSSSGPSHLDEYQGELGDCYLISSLGTIADTAPATIENMIIPNGDGTWTVRFYDNGQADYVTVNDELPTSGGMLVFDGYGHGTTNPPGLWIALIEKAYAQWDETGNEGRGGTNSYADIQGGWMANVDAQVLGHAAPSYDLSSSSDLQALISGMTNEQAVTVGTDGSNNSNDSLPYGLYGSHAYAVTGYNSSNQTFTLYNPWGMDQPAQALTWAQLQATCDGLVVANPTGTQSFATSLVMAPRPMLAPRPAVAEASDAAAAFSTATDDFRASSDAGQAVDSLLARQTVNSLANGDSSSDNNVPISQASVNSGIDSALKALDAMQLAVSDAIMVRRGRISARLDPAAVDSVFEASR
jgi:hypothetical protein